MTVVVDASCVVAALVDEGVAGRWAEGQLTGDDLAAPHLMPVEVAGILRRAVLAGELTHDVGSLAHGDLLALPVELFAYEPLAERVWELGRSVTAYDAWYVALAELLGAPLATADIRLSRSQGPRCAFLTPSD
jgi:predicted nucleic acid-binding protein